MIYHSDFTSFRNGDLFISSSDTNNAVAKVTLFKFTSLTDSSMQSASCNSTKASILRTVTGEVSRITSWPAITCVDSSHTFNWTFSKCGSYLSSISAKSIGSNSMIAFTPCQEECGRTPAEDGITLLVVDFLQKKPAPLIRSIILATSKSKIVAEVLMSAPGSIYCSVFPLSYVPASVDLVVMGGNVASSSEENVTLVVTMSNLQAASSYSMYCVTYSVQGVRMAYDAMINTKKIVTTLCCKYVIAELLVNSFTKDSSEQNALRLSLDSPLSTDTTVYLSLKSLSTSSLVSDNSKVNNVFFPEKVVFKAAVMRTAIVSLQAKLVGAYKLDFTLSGTNTSSEVKMLYPGGLDKVTVVEANQKLPPPQFLSAEFSQTGASLTVKFTAPTNKARLPSSFACSRLLSFTGKKSDNAKYILSYQLISTYNHVLSRRLRGSTMQLGGHCNCRYIPCWE